ncbi:MAG: gliding motility-associated C-terminal domain-containing protein [Luteibaculum sp.]
MPTTLNNNYGFNIAIKGTAQNGVDYRFIEDSLNIPAGQTSVSFVILPLTDSIVDPGETVEICILDPCTKQELACETITIEELEAEITEEQDICYGDSVQLEVTYNANYNYSWSPSNSLSCSSCHNPIAFPLDSTEYTVTVSDKTCSITRKVQVNVAAGQLPLLQDTIACIGAEKKVDVSTPGFNQYDWLPNTTGLSGASSSSPTFTVLDSAVTYTVTAENDYGCILTTDITITPREAVDATLIPTDIKCFGDATGRLRVQVNSSTAIDSFLWADGFLGNPYNNLVAGDYEVELVDIYGCRLLLDTTLEQPDAPLEAEAFMVEPSQCGGPEGVVEVEINGGTPPYGINWTPVGGNATRVENLFPGVYRAAITDFNGCTVSDTAEVLIDNSNQQDATITPFGPFCLGADPHQIVVAMPGGDFSGPGVNAQGLFTPANAGSGIHQIIYRLDAAYCSDADTFLVEVNSSFQADMDTVLPPCELAGPITLKSITSGGLYWGPGIADSAFNVFRPQLAGPGIHTIYHLIQGECGELDSLDILVIAADVAEIDSLPDFCPTGASGQLMAQPTAGTWSGPGVSPQGIFDPGLVGSGTYTLTYTPDKSCRVIDSKEITVVDTLRVTGSSINLACNGDANGTVTTGVVGGALPYNFQWAGSVAGDTAVANNLVAGTYTVTVIDALGCSENATHLVQEPSPMVFTQAEVVDSVSCFGYCDGTVRFYPSGGSGPYIYSISPNTGSFNGSDGFNALCAGGYELTLTDQNNCSVRDSFFIPSPEEVRAFLSVDTAFCNQPNGAIILDSIKGGVAPFDYIWSNGSTSQDLVNVVPGDYTLEVQDANGCSYFFTDSVPNSGGPVLDGGQIPVLCNGESSGKAYVTASAGSPGYTYNWENGLSLSDTLSGVAAGSYTVVVTDSENCSTTYTQTVTQPTAVYLNDPLDSVICFGQRYEFQLTASGGNPTTNYAFEMDGNSLSGNNVDINSSGQYTFQAFDSENCPSNTQVVNLTVRPPLQVMAAAPDSICPSASVVKTASTSGGRLPHNIIWFSMDASRVLGTGTSITYNSGSNPYELNRPADTLMVVASDNCSPNDTTYTIVRYYELPELDAKPDKDQGCVPLDVEFTIQGNNYNSLEWKLAGQTYTDTNRVSMLFTSSGVYGGTVNAISDDGCPVQAQILPEVTVHPIPQGRIGFSPSHVTTLSSTAAITLGADVPLSQINWFIVNSNGDTISRFNGSFNYFDFPETKGIYEIYAEYLSVPLCFNTALAEIEVKSEDAIYVPSAFTPNGDGANDEFAIEILGEKPKTFTVSIYDRWGEQVFASQEPDFSWDGTYLGEVAKPGVYVWKIDYESIEGDKRDYTGKVTLVR